MKSDIKVSIREFSDTDTKQVGDIIQASMLPSLESLSDDTKQDILSKHTNSEIILEKAKKGKYFVAETTDSHKIVGVIGLIDGEVKTFYVHPKFQGLGIGRKLMVRLESEAKQRGLSKIKTRSSPVAEPIYKKLGFKVLEYEWQEKAGNKYYNVWMEKEL